VPSERSSARGGRARRPVVTVSDFPAKASTLTTREIAALCRRCEQLGLGRFAVTDWPYHLDCLTTITACLAATSTIVVESLVTTPYARHPEATACGFASLSEYSGGRVICGIGGGVEEPSNVWVEPFGHKRPKPLRAMRELIALCRAMWAGEASPTEGEVLRGSGLRLRFPVEHPIPVLVAARGPRMLELAGELADIVHIAAPFLGERYIDGCIERIATGAARARRRLDDLEIDLSLSAAVLEDGEEARRLAKVVTAYGIIWMAGVERYARQRPSWTVPDELAVPGELVERLATSWDMWSGDPLPDECAALMDDAVLALFGVAGTPAECAPRLRALLARHPEVTGLRLKLPPLSGPTSAPGYGALVEGVAAALADA